MAGEPSRLLLVDAPRRGRSRWAASFVLGTPLALAGLLSSVFLSGLILGFPLHGADFSLVGIFRLILVPLALWLGIRPVRIGFSEIGLRGPEVRSDALLGAAVAVGFAILQFGVIFPATGGATRSDLVVESAQIGDSWLGVLGYIILAWTGAPAEELLFRGHFLTTLRNSFGSARWSLPLACALTIVVFALLHGYQGWAGVVDTGLYGGLLLTGLFLWRGGRLTACIVAHAGWNTLAPIGIYLWY